MKKKLKTILSPAALVLLLVVAESLFAEAALHATWFISRNIRIPGVDHFGRATSTLVFVLLMFIFNCLIFTFRKITNGKIF